MNNILNIKGLCGTKCATDIALALRSLSSNMGAGFEPEDEAIEFQEDFRAHCNNCSRQGARKSRMEIKYPDDIKIDDIKEKIKSAGFNIVE